MASMADVSYETVHLGPWIDRSKGSVSGANITVTSTNGAILVAFLALFVQFAGQHLWGIACFAWHQCRISRRSKSPLQYQQDVSLRNNASPGQTLWYLLQIAWSWRHARGQPGGWWRVAAFPAIIPLLFQGIIFATGILSSTIVETSDVEVLLRGDHCGIWKVPSQDTIDAYESQFMVENQRYMRRVNEFSRIYARGCYNKTDVHVSPSCQAFTQESIPYSSLLNASCPFDPITCVSPSANLRMDTGKVDTNDIFGLNSRIHNIELRKVTSCAPMKPDLYTTRRNLTSQGADNETDFEIMWNWGKTVAGNYLARADSRRRIVDYNMEIAYRYPMDSRMDVPNQSLFIPRPEFNVSDGDTKLLFLNANGISFTAPCDDPWFSAHKPYAERLQQNRTFYRPDYLASPVGCVEQYQFCNPHQRGQPCTPIAGIIPAAASAKFELALSPMQSAIVDLFVNAIYAVNTDIAQPNLHKTDLLAEEGATNGWQLPLPNNQWTLELQDMHNKVLAMLQRVIVDYARGPGSTSAQKFIAVPDNRESTALCSMLRARTNGRFSNVNTYGLVIVLSIGTLIILTNFFLIDLVVWAQKCRKADPLKSDRWVADGLFQVQKSLFEIRGQGLWRETQSAVPITERYDVIVQKAERAEGKIEVAKLPTFAERRGRQDTEQMVVGDVQSQASKKF
ncbi:hypothetical protein K469DRAFT_667831 [Zopfia rhizophila CBS 207.26]|uniref:Uncharacterized protein n=1 Tax=Zopfia rhizophila CBS 207.26 TaxID=1314779 RepID=A0A6A6DVB9_9PEZI|nr:hypothetical protein K469DRAFT_667831 [Zopfia rhizophila CBS 207.26]